MGIALTKDFKEFLKLFRDHGVEYLLIGGYAVGYYGYPRATGDLDVWIAPTVENASRAVAALRDFGFDTPNLSIDSFLTDRIVRMGVPPMRIEILTGISGLTFEECYPRRLEVQMDGVPVSIIDLEHLKRNKRASGRHKDFADLDHLP